MRQSVLRWMEAEGLLVKSEFISPWGICDLVGIEFNKRRVSHRFKLGQKHPVQSLTGAGILLLIPDLEEGISISVEQLINECAPAVKIETVLAEVERLIAHGFVIKDSTNRLQKLNGWMPLQKRFVAIEMKLSRVEEVKSQAENNLGFADESYAALPEDVATRVIHNAGRRAQFERANVGILSVTPKSCKIVLRPRNLAGKRKDALQLYCVEKFWRTFKGNLA